MSYANTQVLTCPRLQDALNNEFMCHNERVKEKLGTFDFVNSPLNTNGILREQLNHKPGKKKLVELTYKPRELESTVETDTSINCDGGDEPGELSTTYELPTEGVSRKWTIENAKFTDNCEELESWIATEFQRKFDVLSRVLNRITIQRILQEFGTHAITKTSDAVDVRTQVAGNGGDDFGLIESVSEEHLENLSCNMPFVFGSRELYKYFKRIDANCCADRGQDLATFAAQNDVTMIYDKMVRAEFNDDGNQFFSLAPGTVIPLFWNQYVSPAQQFNDDTYKQGTLVDPATGVMYDYVTKFDCGKWHFQLALNYDVAVLPDDLFCVGDDLNGVNWITHWNINNP